MMTAASPCLYLNEGVSHVSYNELRGVTRMLLTYSKRLKMVDPTTKKTLATIPLLKTRAGPRDGDVWVDRLKEEYLSLIQVRLTLKQRHKWG